MDSDFFIPGGLFEDDESMQSMSGINPGAREFRPTEPEPRARRAQSADAPPPAFAGGGLLSPSQLGAAAAAPRGAGPPGLDPRRPRLGSASGAPGAGLGDRGDAWRHHNERMTTAAAAAAAALRALAEEDAKGRALATSSAASWDAAPAAWSAPAAPAPGLDLYLESRGLGAYAARIRALGARKVADLQLLSDEDIDDLGVPKELRVVLKVSLS